jgi:hypothetical protein
MSHQTTVWPAAALALVLAIQAHASLIGATVVYTNATAPELNGTFVVGSGIEDNHCYFAAGGTCLLGAQVDYGIDAITNRVFDFLDVGFAASPNSVMNDFGSTVSNIVGATILSSTFPGIFDVSFTNHSVGFTHNAWFWAPHSDYTLVLGVKTVPEPETLSLLSAGLLGLVVLRRRRFAAR